MRSIPSFRRATRFIALIGVVVATAASCTDSSNPLVSPDAADPFQFGNTLIGSGNSIQPDTASTVATSGNSESAGTTS